MYTKKSFILSDSHQKAELIAEMNKTLPSFRNGYAYDFELSNGRNYLDAVRDQWADMGFCFRLVIHGSLRTGSYLRFSRDRRRENPKIVVKMTGSQAIGDKQVSKAFVL